MKKFFKDNADGFYVVFRILIGLLFLVHGLAKFGIVGGKPFLSPAEFMVAAILEVIVGVLVIVGLFTRLAALVGGIEMIVAFVWKHLPNGINPLANGGEAALLYLAAFLILMAYGPGKWSLGTAMFKKEVW